MILSDVDIRRSINLGEIGIDPFNPARLNPASYTLSLGDILRIPRPNDEIIVPDEPVPDDAYDEVRIGNDGYVVYPGEFLLGSVAERITVSTSLAARLDARTTLARLAFDVLRGSTHIEPGQHDSRETLEISNGGSRPVLLILGMKIAKIVFMRLQTEASSGYAGSYAGQKGHRTQ